MKISSFQVENMINKIASEKLHGCLLFGPNAALVRMRMQIIAKKITPNLSDPFLVSNLAADSAVKDQALLADEFFSLPMLGGRKLIIVKDCENSFTAPLKSLISNKIYGGDIENFILLTGGDLEKSSSLRKFIEESRYFISLPCYEDDENAVEKFITARLQKIGIQADRKIIQFFLQKIGKNRQIIFNEIEKIANYLGSSGQSLTMDLVEKICGQSLGDLNETESNDFISAFADNDIKNATQFCEKLLMQKEGEVSLLRFLLTYYHKLYSAKIAIESRSKSFEEAVKAQKIYFKAENNFRRNLQKLSREDILKNLHKIEKTEIEVKSGKISARNSMLWMVLRNEIKKILT